ncbi:hypothetical protein BpHYR1_026357 [Brachionus plicatilis]|uniref:Uncharacterized protein n=1 Tax=Brachionus plicatilis TaxID=10195 RepID=A0A3M7S1L6_BRAPC|nr:hypothetical protein BpHYR1_026357 [Brachionus plicatilis]
MNLKKEKNKSKIDSFNTTSTKVLKRLKLEIVKSTLNKSGFVFEREKSEIKKDNSIKDLTKPNGTCDHFNRP